MLRCNGYSSFKDPYHNDYMIVFLSLHSKYNFVGWLIITTLSNQSINHYNVDRAAD